MNANILHEQPGMLDTPAEPSFHQYGETHPHEEAPGLLPEVESTKQSPIREAAQELKESGAESLKAAKEAGAGFIAEQKEKLAARIEEYSGSLLTVSESLKRDETSALAGPTEKVAARLKNTAVYLRNKELPDMYEDLENFARRRPEVVYGALFIAGLAAVRFLKASAPKPQSA